MSSKQKERLESRQILLSRINQKQTVKISRKMTKYRPRKDSHAHPAFAIMNRDLSTASISIMRNAIQDSKKILTL
jgi:hypothetical protein